MMKLLNSNEDEFETKLNALLDRDTTQDREIEATARDIIDAVRLRGDEALIEYSQRFDRLDISSPSALEIDNSQLKAAFNRLDSNLQTALTDALTRIRYYHQQEVATSWSYTETDGSRLGQVIRALDRVGVYVPGGKAAYPSSVLMTTIPAKIAGVEEIIMVVPTPDGEVNPSVLAAAYLGGVDRVFRVGGAQAIAALAYGTHTIPAVDKIVGPGNAYVAAAKRQVFGQVGIDMIAGPSEVVVVADDSAKPDWIAMDLFAQAEHDELAQSILITHSQSLATQVAASIQRLLPNMTRSKIIDKALSDFGAIIVTSSWQASLGIANRIAPEHLELMLENIDEAINQVRHAGAIFVGENSAESLGDYCAGPNHVLPTAGTARFSSPLGVYDFQKRSSLIHLSTTGAGKIAPTAEILARSEGLTAHAKSAQLRIKP